MKAQIKFFIAPHLVPYKDQIKMPRCQSCLSVEGYPDASKDLGDGDYRTCGCDPNQLLPALAFPLQTCPFCFFQTQEVSAEILAIHMYDNHVAGLKALFVSPMENQFVMRLFNFHFRDFLFQVPADSKKGQVTRKYEPTSNMTKGTVFDEGRA
jgi:hypothetical protein